MDHPEVNPQEHEYRLARLHLPRWVLLCCAVLSEAGFALVLNQIGALGLLHAAVIAAIGFYGIISRNLALVVGAIAYTTGTEVLWRQTRAPVFYLTAPYLVIGLSILAVVLILRHLGKDARIAALYAMLLVPAAVATIRTAGSESRELIAFALSGPIALASFVMLTSQVRITPLLYRRLLWVILISAVGPLTVALSDMRADLATQGSISFTTQSNFATSGGFGPVQVSAALSIGMMAAVVLIIIERDRVARIIAAALTVVLAVQTLLTFSRGGSFSLGIAVAAFAITQARNRRIRNRVMLIAAVSFALANFVIFPRLESFTGGMFQQRFSDTDTARTELASNDLEIFQRNVAFGVGPGMTKYQRLTYEICQIRSDRCRNEASSHTEFTRTLSEHGIPGLIAIALLLTLAWNGVRRAGAGSEFAVAWMAWAIAQMFYANLRIVAVPVAFGIAFLRFSDRSPPSDDDGDEANDRSDAAYPGRAAWHGRSLQSMGRTPNPATTPVGVPVASAEQSRPGAVTRPSVSAAGDGPRLNGSGRHDSMPQGWT